MAIIIFGVIKKNLLTAEKCDPFPSGPNKVNKTKAGLEHIFSKSAIYFPVLVAALPSIFLSLLLNWIFSSIRQELPLSNPWTKKQ